MTKNHHQVIWKNDPRYPLLLREIPDGPGRLFLLGQEFTPDDHYFAIVGTRHATPYGREVAAYFSEGLVRAGFVIVSGLAYGIDTVAHESALRAKGKTIAVLGSGLDHISPRSNRKLATQIAEHGAIITEYEADMAPFKGNFPQRNRIIAGMSIATLVIEAPEKSGALITARLALEYNREVFSVPGNITHENSSGTNRLLKDSRAHCVSSVQDILEVLELLPEIKTPQPPQLFPDATTNEHRIHTALKKGPCSMDVLIEDTGLTVAEISSTLSQFEMKGMVKNNGGIYQKII